MPEKDSSAAHPLDIGTVAEEAERLVAAMRARSQAAGTAHSDEGAPTDDGPTDPVRDTEEIRPIGAGGDTDSLGAGGDSDSRGPCERLACGVCPVCRGAAFVDALPADTLESVADLVSMAAVTLRKLAASARAAQSAGEDDTAD